MKSVFAILLAVMLVVSGLGGVAYATDSGHMGAWHQRTYKADILDPYCDLVEPYQPLTGTYGWSFHIGNNIGGQVTLPTISVTSSLDPALFPAAASWPYDVSLDSLENGERWIMMDLGSSALPAEFQTGYRVSRTMTPLEIPPGGGEQEVEVTVTPVDGRYDSEENWGTFMRLGIQGNVVPGSNTQPEGAQVTITEGEHIVWEFPGASDIGTEYKFTVRLQVQNPLDVSILHKPYIGTYMEVGNQVAEVTSASVSISDLSDPVLEATYSVVGEQHWYCWLLANWRVAFAPVSEPLNQVPYILDFIDASVAGGTLTGDGPGKSAGNRLNALKNMIEAAGGFIDAGDTSQACQQLLDAYKKCDGDPKPPDFVIGTAAGELAGMIQALRASLGCG